MIGQRGQPYSKHRRYRERRKRKGLCPNGCSIRPRGHVYCRNCRRKARARKRNRHATVSLT